MGGSSAFGGYDQRSHIRPGIYPPSGPLIRSGQTARPASGFQGSTVPVKCYHCGDVGNIRPKCPKLSGSKLDNSRGELLRLS